MRFGYVPSIGPHMSCGTERKGNGREWNRTKQEEDQEIQPVWLLLLAGPLTGWLAAFSANLMHKHFPENGSHRKALFPLLPTFNFIGHFFRRT